MTFRARMLLGFGLVVLVPLAVFGLRVRAEMATRLTGEYGRRVQSLVAVIRADLDRQSAGIGTRLDALKEAIAADNRFRAAALQGAERTYLLDYAGNAMRLAGFAMLQVQDDQGRIVSSGHFRNEYDRAEPSLPRLLVAAGGTALVQARSAEGPFLTLARVDSVRLGGRSFTLVGGLAVDSAFLARLAPDSELTVAVALAPDTVTRVAPATQVVSALTVPFIPEGDAARLAPARIVVTHSLASLASLRRGVELSFLAAVLATGAIALLLAAWLATRISRPLTALAERTAEIDMDRLDVAFESTRSDEVGTLARVLGAMTDRLRTGAARLREAERRLALGDLARQVNHDIKNGLIPIRNVFRHFAQAAREGPERLAAAFHERQPTVDASIGYLENLASNYARLYPQTVAEACDVNAVVRETIRLLGDPGAAELRMELADGLPPVRTDALVLRRILENLTRNALDSLTGAGRVTVATVSAAATDGQPLVRIVVADTGRGMGREELDRAFDDFYTTKPGGTGLGLSIVRRLVLDAHGALRVETELGAGSRFIIELPGAAA